MTNHPAPTPTTFLEALETALKECRLFTSVEVLHGKFRIEDLDKMSFRTPAAFVSIAYGKPEIEHDGSMRLEFQAAVMIVNKTGSHREDPWQTATEVVRLVHRNTFGFKHLRQPTGFDVIPVLTSQERNKNQSLTAVTWRQNMRLADPPDRSRTLEEVVSTKGHTVYKREPEA